MPDYIRFQHGCNRLGITSIAVRGSPLLTHHHSPTNFKHCNFCIMLSEGVSSSLPPFFCCQQLSGVLKCEQLVSQQAKVVWEKRKDFANLKCKSPSLLNAKKEKELFYDKERDVKKAKPEVYIYYCSLRTCQLKTDFVVALGESSSRVKTHDINLGSPVSHHDTVVRPKERAMEILVQVDREMGRIKEHNHHWEDRMEVNSLNCLHSITHVSTDRQIECISAPAYYSSSMTFQVVSST